MSTTAPMADVMDPALFRAPGPGTWELDADHFPAPVFGLVEEVFPTAFTAGMGSALQKYGMLLAGFEVACVGGFPYMKAKPLGAPEGGGAPPPPWLFKILFKALTTLHPEFRRRLREQRDLFTRRPWREAVRDWNERMKPETLRAHAAVDNLPLDDLDDAGLVAALEQVRAHAIRVLTQDHSLNLDTMIPVGDFVARTCAWTGLDAAAALGLLKGSSPISAGASSERLALLVALEADAPARSVLESEAPPTEIWRRLLGWPGAVGEAMKAYRVVWGNAILHGLDPSCPTAEEAPGPTLLALRISLRDRTRPQAPTGPDPADAVRARVPEAHRAAFDDALEDARLTYGLRDERHLYGALPVLGLGRRVLLAVRDRLVRRGALSDPDLVFVARFSELESLLTEPDLEPLVRTLAARRAYAQATPGHLVPAHLGAAPQPPPPTDWLPTDAARRAMTALDTYLSVGAGTAATASTGDVLTGLGVSAGSYEGRARIVSSAEDLERIEPGDVLVAPLTSPVIQAVLPLLGAIVTDRGGALSHAAIVTREYGLPGVVGVGDATRRIQDGQRVRVDGTRGVVTVLR